MNDFNMNRLATASAFVDSDANFVAATSYSVAKDQVNSPYVNHNMVDEAMQQSYPEEEDCNSNSPPTSDSGKAKKRRTSPSSATKIQQLPMFLTKTYHMIEKSDPEIATWSEAGDNFVVKNVDQFAQEVLPQYFKHSNFSSFARQLNFYGFRKLKAEPILTADFDARTATHVRFFHEHFHRHKPELLVHIKRATKADPQSKDEIENLRSEILDLRSITEQQASIIENMKHDFDRRLSDLAFEMNAKYNKLIVRLNMIDPNSTGFGASTGLNNMNFSLGNPPNSGQKSQSLSMLTQACSMIKSPSLSPSILPPVTKSGNTSFATFSLE